MKYPQLMSMPSSVQEWLDEQLEARGIDAVVYTRHVLSLLQRDTLDIPEDGIATAPHRAKKCGIEKLVDDLCIKLKEIKSQSESSVVLELSEATINSSLTDAPSDSPHDEARKYYAAFPPLSSRFAESQKIVQTSNLEHVSVWSCGKRSSTDVQIKLSEVEDSRNIWEEDKENVVVNADKNTGSRKQIGGEGVKSRVGPQGPLETSVDCGKGAGYGFTWDMDSNAEKDNGGGELTPRRLYLRQGDSPGLYTDGEQAEEKNLARLIAKFDESIEALWSPTEVDVPPPQTSDCYQELPVDLSHLLSSPSPAEQSLAAELGGGVMNSNCFIPSGTNITSSIWSDCTEDSLADVDGATRQSADEGELSSNGATLARLLARDCGAVGSRLAPSYCVADKKYTLLFDSLEPSKDDLGDDTEDRANIVWNEAETLPSFFTSLPFGLSYALGDLTQDVTSQKWSDYESSSVLGSMYPFEQILAENCNNYQRSVRHSNRLLSVGIDGQYTTLNHNKAASSFTEVIPKSNYDEKHTAPDMIMDCIKTKLGTMVPGHRLQTSETVEDEDLLTSPRTHFKPIKQENADSLCGHIRGYADGTTFVIPDGLEVLAFKRCQSGTLYLESEERLETPAKYREYKEKEPYGGRRQCGDDDENVDAGTEFIPKFKVCSNEKCCQTEEIEGLSDEVVHSKRSRHGERSAEQTRTDAFFFPGDEHLAMLVASCLNDGDEEESMLDDDDSYSNCDSIPSAFNTSSAVQLAQAWRRELKVCYKCNNNNNTVNAWASQDCGGGGVVWGEGGTVGQPWADIWSAEAGQRAPTPCRNCSLIVAAGAAPATDHGAGGTKQRDRMREELSRDGEQLLSDLSYMQHLFLGSGWLEETGGEDPQILPAGGDWGDEEDGGEPMTQKFQCISPVYDVITRVGDDEMVMYTDDARCSRSLPGNHPAREAGGARCEAKSVDDFFSKCLLNVLPKTILLHADLEAELKLNERPSNAKVITKDRKRRHSASQRVTSREVATSGVLRSQTSCVKGISCPQFILEHVRALRPVTL